MHFLGIFISFIAKLILQKRRLTQERGTTNNLEHVYSTIGCTIIGKSTNIKYVTINKLLVYTITVGGNTLCNIITFIQ